MAYEQKPDSGALFPNKRKEKESHPDLTGTLDVGGVQYWINAWSKTAKTNGEEWLSISIRPKDAQSQPAQNYRAPSGGKWARPAAPAALNPSEAGGELPNRITPEGQAGLDAASDEVPF
jgi:hypothetical protein